MEKSLGLEAFFNDRGGDSAELERFFDETERMAIKWHELELSPPVCLYVLMNELYPRLQKVDPGNVYLPQLDPGTIENMLFLEGEKSAHPTLNFSDDCLVAIQRAHVQAGTRLDMSMLDILAAMLADKFWKIWNKLNLDLNSIRELEKLVFREKYKLSSEVCDVFFEAEKHARFFGHANIGTDHILRAVVWKPRVQKVLRHLGIDSRAVTSAINSMIDPGPSPIPMEQPILPSHPVRDFCKALGRIRTHFKLQELYSEHLFVALLEDRETTAFRVMKECRVERDKIFPFVSDPKNFENV